MKPTLLPFLATALLLAACSGPGGSTGLPTGVSAQAYDANALGGLSDTEAAHPSVEVGAPKAFALMPDSAPYLLALSRVVVPMRSALASKILADAGVSAALAQWDTIGGAAQLAALKQVAVLEGQVMNCQVPPVVEQSGMPSQPGLMAYFQPDQGGDIGQVVLYQDTVSKATKYTALATVVHEMRHAAQYQLVQADQNGSLAASDSDSHTLARAYADTWAAMDSLGGESKLAYGDYAHLNVEYDAFQTGNNVGQLVAKGQYNALGLGFIDAQFDAKGTPGLDLVQLSTKLSAKDLVAAVNAAEHKAEAASGQPVVGQRHAKGKIVPRKVAPRPKVTPATAAKANPTIPATGG